MNKIEKNYWDKYYKEHNVPSKPSNFAIDCIRNYLKPGMDLLELGCGNGRDAIYMSKHGINVTAVDSSEYEINFLKKNFSGNNLFFDCKDFSNLPYKNLFDAVYSRFALHACTEKQENNTITYAFDHLKDNSLFLIEARGTENEYFGRGELVKNEKNTFFYEGHLRRFIDRKELEKKLKQIGFTIIVSDEENGRAPFNETDYKFLRIIARKHSI